MYDAEEFIRAKKLALVRAGKKLRDAAVQGDAKTLARMVLKGEPVYIDERDWYLRDLRRREARDGDTPDTNAALSTTGEARVLTASGTLLMGAEAPLLAHHPGHGKDMKGSARACTWRDARSSHGNACDALAAHADSSCRIDVAHDQVATPCAWRPAHRRIMASHASTRRRAGQGTR